MQIICIFDKQSAKLNEGAGGASIVENMEIYLHYTRILLQINDLDVSDVQNLECYGWKLQIMMIIEKMIWKYTLLKYYLENVRTTFINIIIFSAIGSIINLFSIRASLKKEK